MEPSDKVQCPGWGSSLPYPPLSLAWAHTRGAPARIPAQSAATRSRSLILGVGDGQPGLPPLSLGLGRSEPGALPPPVPVLPAGPRLPSPDAPQSCRHSREKSLIPRGRSGGRGPRRPTPTHRPRGRRPCYPSPRQTTRLHLSVKPPTLVASGIPLGGSLQERG